MVDITLKIVAWLLPIGGFMSIVVYQLKRRDDRRKGTADGLHACAKAYAELVADGATILTHEKERENFRIELTNLVNSEAAEAAIFALGDNDDMLAWKAALEKYAREFNKAGNGKRNQNSLMDCFRSCRQATEANGAFLEQEFALGGADALLPVPQPRTRGPGVFRRCSED